MIARNLRYVDGDTGASLHEQIGGMVVLRNRKGDTLILQPEEVAELPALAGAFTAIPADNGKLVA